MQHERIFRVRHYECDAFDRVSHTNYLRYIQETAMDASAVAGFGGDWYLANGFIWFVRDTHIEFFQPLRYGDSVRVGTRVRNMRQALSKRVYELHRVADNALVARAETDWAFIESASGKPARIPQAIRDAFFPGSVPSDEPRDRFPAPPSPPAEAFTQRRRVDWRDIDPAHHVNNSVYLAYSEDCAVEALRAFGWPPMRMRDEGFTLDMKSCRLEYRAPAMHSDDLEITTWFSDVTESTALRHVALHRMRDNAELARARIQVCCTDSNTGSPRAFDSAFLHDLRHGMCHGALR